MAKIGEGDPRWVVREREDGTNVNAWHWSGERDVSEWADKRLRELIEPIASTSVQVTKFNKLEGDAILYNRKATLKVVYDLKASGEWESIPPGASGKFSFELFDDEPDISVSQEKTAPGYEKAKAEFIAQCVPNMLAGCKTFVRELMAGANLSEADKTRLQRTKLSAEKSLEPEVTDFTRTPSVDAFSEDVQKRANRGKAHEITDTFVCSVNDLFNAITDRPRLEAVTRARAVSDCKIGGKWEVLDGMARGKFLEIVPDSLVVLNWRMKGWSDNEPDCRVEMRISPGDGRCCLTIAIFDLNEARKSSVEGFWRVQILQAIKIVMGYGSASFL